MIKKILFLSVLLALGVDAPAQAQTQTQAQAQTPAKSIVAFKITSRAFVNEANIPTKYTCDSVNVSPALAWNSAPAGTKSFALIIEDPDAPNGDWVHWVAYNIPATAHGLPEHVPADAKLADGTLQGKTSFNKPGYGGPCPPKGKGPHRYFFRLYALDSTLTLPADTTDSAALKAGIKDHTLGTAELMGKFEH